MMKRWGGKVAGVTGENSGFGLSTATSLQQEDARIAILGRSKGTFDERFAITSPVSRSTWTVGKDETLAFVSKKM
jgi:NADP-dependent 3-hydroxy acid dehydrogenase YdfG